MNILVVDVGGTHVKILATGHDTFRQFDSGPALTPETMVSNVLKLSYDWKYDVVTIGYPGPVLRGRPVSEPYNLGAGWVGFDFEAAFKLPVKFVNDAAMQALGSYHGGKMLFLGLGTGLGSAMIVEGIVEPMELGHLPYKRATFEDYIGIRGLEQHGQKKWRQYVVDVVKRLVAALEPDEVVLGGGNVHKLEKLPAGCRAGDNTNAFKGGFRLWEKPVESNSSSTAKVGIALSLVLLVSVGTAHAQEKSLQPAVSEVSTNLSSGPSMTTNAVSGLFGGSSSDSSQNSANLRPFQLTLPQGHLFGDWYGLRPTLADWGLTPTLTYVADIAGNPTGGKSQGVAYSDNIGLDLLFDLNKIIGLEGGSFLVSMSQRNGDSLSGERVGNIFTIQQNYGGQTFHLIDVAYQQKLLDDSVEFRVGRIAMGDDFLVSPYDYVFMQNAFCGNPKGVFINAPGATAYPGATWGALLKVKPTQRTYVMAGVYNGDPSIGADYHNGADFSMNGPVFAIGEVGYQINGLPGESRLLGNYKLGFWYDNADYTDYNTVGFAHPAGTKRGNYGLYAMFDQVLVSFGEPTSNRGFGIFGTFMASPDESVSQMPYFFDAGIVSRGIFVSRPIDVLGFGVAYGSFSGDLSNAQEREQQLDPTVGVQDYETVLELTYRFRFRDGAFFFQPDIQYVIKPGGTGDSNDALVLGCQVGINF
jgi:carbohydrate-selective porin OprB/predicted NBD/HSP70 family sugar kinase